MVFELARTKVEMRERSNCLSCIWGLSLKRFSFAWKLRNREPRQPGFGCVDLPSRSLSRAFVVWFKYSMWIIAVDEAEIAAAIVITDEAA